MTPCDDIRDEKLRAPIPSLSRTWHLFGSSGFVLNETFVLTAVSWLVGARTAYFIVTSKVGTGRNIHSSFAALRVCPHVQYVQVYLVLGTQYLVPSE